MWWRKPTASSASRAGTGRPSPATACGRSSREAASCAAYVARVRITVRAGETRIVREGCGVGESSALSPGQAYDFAAKAAETDATKRALMTFGNAFGLSLYGGTGATPVSNPRQRSKGVPAHPEQTLPQASEPAASAVSEERPDLSSTGPSTTSATPDDVPAADIFPGDRDEPGFRPIDKSVLALAEPRRVRDPEHLRLVASQPCLVCGRSPAEAHHLRFAQPRAMSRKVSDEFTVPNCARCITAISTTVVTRRTGGKSGGLSLWTSRANSGLRAGHTARTARALRSLSFPRRLDRRTGHPASRVWPESKSPHACRSEAAARSRRLALWERPSRAARPVARRLAWRRRRTRDQALPDALCAK